MKIAVLAHCHHPIRQPFPGGLEAHTALIADELVRRGHRVTLFAKAGSRSLAEVHPVVDAQFTHGAAPDENGIDQSQAIVDQGMERAVAAIKAGGFDVVLNNSLNPIPYVALDDHPMLTLLHTPATLERTLAAVTAPGWRPGARHAYAAVSEVTGRDWSRFLPEVHCIPNGIEVAAWAPRQPYSPIPDLAVWAARITPEKGLPLAIAATRAAGMRLEFSGPVADRRHFSEEVQPLLGADVRYSGHLNHEELPEFFARGSVFISSPTWAEPFGLAMVEAMACGTPSPPWRGEPRPRSSIPRSVCWPAPTRSKAWPGRSGKPSGSTVAACVSRPSGSTSRSCSTDTKPCCWSWPAPAGPWLNFTHRSTSRRFANGSPIEPAQQAHHGSGIRAVGEWHPCRFRRPDHRQDGREGLQRPVDHRRRSAPGLGPHRTGDGFDGPTRHRLINNDSLQTRSYEMRAVTWQGKREVSVETVPDPKIEQPTDAIIKVTSHQHLRLGSAPLRDAGRVHDARRHPRPRADGHRRGGRQRASAT